MEKYQQCLAIEQKVYGPHHPSGARTRRNIVKLERDGKKLRLR